MTGERLQFECRDCGFGMDAPDTPLGRAIMVELDKEHEGHDVERKEP